MDVIREKHQIEMTGDAMVKFFDKLKTGMGASTRVATKAAMQKMQEASDVDQDQKKDF